jgi:hypothetical protein
MCCKLSVQRLPGGRAETDKLTNAAPFSERKLTISISGKHQHGSLLCASRSLHPRYHLSDAPIATIALALAFHMSPISPCLAPQPKVHPLISPPSSHVSIHYPFTISSRSKRERNSPPYCAKSVFSFSTVNASKSVIPPIYTFLVAPELTAWDTVGPIGPECLPHPTLSRRELRVRLIIFA